MTRQSGNQKVLVSPTVSQRTPAKQNHGVDRDDGDGRRSSVRGAPLGTQAKDRNRIRMQAQEQANSSAEGLPKRHLGNFKRNKSRPPRGTVGHACETDKHHQDASPSARQFVRGGGAETAPSKPLKESKSNSRPPRGTMGHACKTDNHHQDASPSAVQFVRGGAAKQHLRNP